VITLGSLSKVLSPGLRIGYAIADPDTAAALAALAEGTYLSPSPLTQAIAARCLAAGTVGAQIERVRDFLGPRHDSAVEAAREHLGDALLTVPDGGYYLAAHLPVDLEEPALLAAARDEGVVLTPGSAFYPGDATPPEGTLFVRLPYQALEPDEFAGGVERLARQAGVEAGVGSNIPTSPAKRARIERGLQSGSCSSWPIAWWVAPANSSKRSSGSSSSTSSGRWCSASSATARSRACMRSQLSSGRLIRQASTMQKRASCGRGSKASIVATQAASRRSCQLPSPSRAGEHASTISSKPSR
jgi:hypothetical protein